MARQVRSFRTDEKGQPIGLGDLDPHTDYILSVDVDVCAARRMESRQEVVDWIEGAVLGDLRTLLVGIRERERTEGVQRPRPLGGGNFLLTAGCVMALEYLAQVYGQKNNATDAVRTYVDDFLRPVNERYSQVFNVLWTCFRNGIVHGSWPQVVCVQGDPTTRIRVGANPDTDGDHLGPASEWEEPSFVVSGARLLADIEASFDCGFRSWVLEMSDDDVLARAAPRLLELNHGDTRRIRQLRVIRGWSERLGKGGNEGAD